MEKREILTRPAAASGLLGAALALPWLVGPYGVHLLSLALIFSVFAVGYNVLFGHTGIVSFGHGIFFGVPAYFMGMLVSSSLHVTNPAVLIATAIIAGLLLGGAVGWVCSFSRGIYLAIITFALAQIVELIVLSDPGGLTRGESGIVGLRPPPIAIGEHSLNLFSGVGLYYVAVAALAIVLVMMRFLLRSQWGQVFHAVRENEQRLLSLGYHTRSYKVLAFCISGGVSAVAGCLLAFLNNIVSPSMVHWHVGAEILLITVLGGSATLFGPILGAFVVVFTEAFATTLVGDGNWIYVLGGLYIAVAMFLPGGVTPRIPMLVSSLKASWDWVLAKRATSP